MKDKSFEKLRDNVEEVRIMADSIFSELDEKMAKMPIGQLTGKKGIELAEKMDALILATRALRRAQDLLNSV